MRLAVAGCVAVAACFALAKAAKAQERPRTGAIVAVVEVNGGHANARAIRARLAKVLGVPVISVFDRGSIAARGTLTIVVDYRRRQARAQYRTRESTLTWTTAAIPRHPDARGLWVVRHAVAVVRAAESYRSSMRFATCLEVLDPWRDDHSSSNHSSSAVWTGYQLPSEVLDPFDDLAPPKPYVAAYELPSEVIDPWAREGHRRRSSRTSR